MKTYKHLWDNFISGENILLAMRNASLGNKNKRTKIVLKKMRDNPEKYIPKIRKYALHFKNARHKPVEIYDGIVRKKRTIIVPKPFEQVIHHMVVNTLKPIFMKSMYQHSYGSIPGRGGVSASKQARKWLPCKYILKTDIRKYFDTVDQAVLIRQLERKIKDERFMALLREIISATESGIPLGFYTSQWFANFYLTEFDHWVTEKLGATHYIRYMDDMVVFGDDKAVLHGYRERIAEYLSDNLMVEMKGNWQVFEFGKRDLDFMGFRFFPHKTILRRSIMYKASRKAKRLSRKAKITWYDACQMLSYNGWLKSTNSYGFFQTEIKPFVSIKKLKHIVSRKDKRRIEDDFCLCGIHCGT